LEAQIEPGIILSGQPDIVARENQAVRDLKTTARTGRASHAPQIGAYSLLARTPTNERPEGLDIQAAAIDEVRRVSPRNPQPDPTSRKVDVVLAETAASKIIAEICAGSHRATVGVS
jgi:hypothetical protein